MSGPLLVNLVVFFVPLVNLHKNLLSINSKLRNDEDLRLPRYKTTTGQRSFIYRAYKIWNSIDETSRQCENVAIFKNKLKSKLVESFIST